MRTEFGEYKGLLDVLFQNNNLLAHKGLTKKRYSHNEVLVANDIAQEYMTHNCYTEDGPTKIWVVHHTLTSDDAWETRGGIHHLGRNNTRVFGVGVGYVQKFMRYILDELNPPSVGSRPTSAVDFMRANFSAIQHPSFMPILRTYLYAYPESCDSSVVNEFDLVIDSTRWLTPYTALQMASKYDEMPPCVMRTLLDAGVSVDLTNNTGSTPLMLAVKYLETDTDSCDTKMDMLLAYGANIDLYDISLRTSLHIASKTGNVGGVRKLLRARQHRIDNDEILYIDPLFHRDYNNKTAFSEAANTLGTTGQRDEMLVLLRKAGASEWLDHHDMPSPNKSHAWVDIPENKTLCYGIITCLESNVVRGMFHMEVTIHRPQYNTNFNVRLDEICGFLDFSKCTINEHSILTRRDLRDMLKSSNGKRFDFFEYDRDGSEISGCDFDILVGTSMNITASGVSTIANRNFVCQTHALVDPYYLNNFTFRFPKGPIDVVESKLVLCRSEVKMSGTVAHLAAISCHQDTSLCFMRWSITQCNPLIKCNNKYTAMEMFYHAIQKDEGMQTTQSRKIVTDLQDSQYAILSFIHREWLPFNCARIGERTFKKPLKVIGTDVKNQYSRFHMLPDDICIRILSYM